MKLILVATSSGKEFYIKTDLDTDLALLRFRLETQESVKHFNDDYCGVVTEDTDCDFLYLSTEVVDDESEDDYDDYDYYHYEDVVHYYESSVDLEPVPCPCCGGSGYM